MTRPAALAAVALLAGLAGAQEKKPAGPPQQLRLAGPDTLTPGTRHLIRAEGLYGSDWRPIDPDGLRVEVAGDGKLAEDPSGKPTNPFEVAAGDAPGKLTVTATAGGRSATRAFAVGPVKPIGPFELTVSPGVVTHKFAGFGAGVLFYDNQFDITPTDDVYDWCFKDVKTTFLHVLIRPDYEKEDAGGDGKAVDLSKFDFKSTERPFRIIRKALERNPGLRVYASLYSPPAWMKTNNATGGQGTLRDGPRFRQRLARYVFAYLKHAHAAGVPVHYLSFFNEPDFPHTQDGMYFKDLGRLAETFAECARALDALTAADRELKRSPVYVFPDTLGPGSITRGAAAQRLRERPRLLDKVGVWGVHDYFDAGGTYRADRFRELRALPPVGRKPVWMTEWCQRERHGDLASGVEYGTAILNAVRLGAEAWMAFEWVHPSGNQAGLLSTDWGAKPPRARYWRSKAYHVFRQVANATPADSSVVSAAGKWTGPAPAMGVEYLALRHGGDVVVHLTNAEPVPVRYRVLVRAPAESAEAWLTGPLADAAPADAEAMTLTRGATVSVGGVIPANATLSAVLHGGKK